MIRTTSKATSIDFEFSSTAQSRARVVAVVVLATPPRWLEITILINVSLRDGLPDAFDILWGPAAVAVCLVTFRLGDSLCAQPVHQGAFGDTQEISHFLGAKVGFYSRLHWSLKYIIYALRDCAVNIELVKVMKAYFRQGFYEAVGIG